MGVLQLVYVASSAGVLLFGCIAVSVGALLLMWVCCCGYGCAAVIVDVLL